MYILNNHPAEIIALHEANVAYTDNPVRGAQLYMNCVQVQVTSSGSLSLPAGTSFPGTSKHHSIHAVQLHRVATRPPPILTHVFILFIW